MAKQLSKAGILEGLLIEAHHVTQSIDAFTGDVAYDITLSGSYTLTGSMYTTDTIYSNNFQASTALTITGNTSTSPISFHKDDNSYILWRNSIDTSTRAYVGFFSGEFRINNSGTGGISLRSNNTDALIIDSSQNVSIPSGSLTLKGTSDAKLILKDPDASNYMEWRYSDSNNRRAYIGFTNTNEFKINLSETTNAQTTITSDEIISDGKHILKAPNSSQMEIHKSGESLIYWYDASGNTFRSYLGTGAANDNIFKFYNSKDVSNVEIYSSGSKAITIDENQNIELPNGNLTINSTQSEQIRLDKDDANHIRFRTNAKVNRGYVGYAGTGDFIINNQQPSNLSIYNNSGESITIDSSQNVTVKENLTVEGVISGDGSGITGVAAEWDGERDTASDSKINLRNTFTTSSNSYISWFIPQSTTRRAYLGFTDSNTFRINNEAAGTSEIVLTTDYFLISDSVGVGMTTGGSPSTKLHLKGVDYINSALTFENTANSGNSEWSIGHRQLGTYDYLSVERGTTKILSINDNNNVAIGPISPEAERGNDDYRLWVEGNVKANSFGTEGNTTKILFPEGGDYAVNANNQTGRIKIKLPTTAPTATQVRGVVKIQTTEEERTFDLHFSFYLENSTSIVWDSAWIVGKPGDYDLNYAVRYGFEGTRAIIMIGENTDNWNYPKITVTDVEVTSVTGNDPLYLWDKGWDIDINTSTPTSINQTISNPATSNWYRNGDNISYRTGYVGIGTLVPDYALSIYGANHASSSIRMQNHGGGGSNSDYWTIGPRLSGGDDGFEIGYSGESIGGKLYITQTGRISIGAGTDPQTKLHVAGTISGSNLDIAGTSQFDNNINVDGKIDGDDLYISGNIGRGTTSNTKAGVEIQGRNSQANLLRLDTTAGGLNGYQELLIDGSTGTGLIGSNGAIEFKAKEMPSTDTSNKDQYFHIKSTVGGDSDNYTTHHHLKVDGDVYLSLTSTDPLATDSNGKIIAGTSDERYKKNITPVTGSLDKLLQLNTYKFKYIEKINMGDAYHFGHMAQEVQSIIPELVKPRPGDEEHLTLSYMEMIPLLVQSIKEQQDIINGLKDEINDLKNK